MHYVWWFPGSPVRIHLALDVVQRLNERLQNSGTGVPQEGLLFGKSLDGATEILDFQPASSRGVTDLLGALPTGPSTLSLVGYYRTEHGETLRLNDSDRSLDAVFFGKPHHVFLVIQTIGFGPPNATFFFHDGGRGMTDFSFPGFPFDSSRLAIEERVRIQRSQQAATEPPVSVPLPATDGYWKKLRVLNTAGWLKFALLVLASGMLIGTLSFRGRGSRIGSAISHPPPQAAHSSQVPLGLQAERQNGDLKLTWNRQSGAVLSATSAVLSIEEGGRRKITLDPAQVRNGSILYAPTTDQVQIQLTVFSPQGTASESVIVILPKAGGPQIQASARRVVGAAPSEDARTARNSVPQHRATKAFTLLVGQHTEASAPALLGNEPPALRVGTDLAASIPPELTLPVAPPSQQAPAQPAATSQNQGPHPSSMSEPSSAPPVYYPPVITNSVIPIFPTELKGLGLKSKTVEIKVYIDETGRVTKTEPLSPKESVPNSMVQTSVEAARLWKFKPARKGTQPIPSQMVLQFAFKP